jgi:hypothetical protein
MAGKREATQRADEPGATKNCAPRAGGRWDPVALAFPIACLLCFVARGPAIEGRDLDWTDKLRLWALVSFGGCATPPTVCMDYGQKNWMDRAASWRGPHRHPARRILMRSEREDHFVSASKPCVVWAM